MCKKTAVLPATPLGAHSSFVRYPLTGRPSMLWERYDSVGAAYCEGHCRTLVIDR